MDTQNIDAFAALQARLTQLENALNNPAPAPATRAEPKVQLPEKFDGDRKNFREFINQLELVFMICPARYPTDAVRVATVGMLLTGRARSWMTPYLENPDVHQDLLNNYANFKALMTSTFGESDRALVSGNKIKRLSQGSRPASSYASDFRLLASDLDWNDDALRFQYRTGLSPKLKDMLLNHPEPENLDDLITLTIRLDNRLYEHRKEMFDQRPHNRLHYAPARATRDTSKPMEIDSVSHRKLTTEEKKRRKENGLCMYCGGSHKLEDCLLRPKKNAPTPETSGKARRH
jgi:hypothetical protein